MLNLKKKQMTNIEIIKAIEVLNSTLNLMIQLHVGEEKRTEIINKIFEFINILN
jgi:hypothetical protein